MSVPLATAADDFYIHSETLHLPFIKPQVPIIWDHIPPI